MVNLNAQRCQIDWPVCPRCPGAVPSLRDGGVHCSQCGGEWKEADLSPCPHPASESLERVTGENLRVCVSHLAYAQGMRSADRWSLGCSTLIYALLGGGVLVAIYLVVRFVHWSWSTPMR